MTSEPRTIAKIIFRKRDLQTIAAPKSEFRIPTGNETCPDIYWQADPSLRITGPRATQVIVIGKNGNPDLSTPTSAQETVKYKISTGAVQLSYEFPETITEVSQVKLTP